MVFKNIQSQKTPRHPTFIDFRKAFDTIEWNFIHECIELYNFAGIYILNYYVKSGVMNAGFRTIYFKVTRGVRQSCPLSFIL